MKLHQLRVFAEAVRFGNLSRAAGALHMTQPAVSQQVRGLEEHFNAQLLERTNQGVEPTQAGQIVFAYATRFFDLSESLEEEIQSLRQAAGGELLVGATSTVGGYAVPCSICIFKERYPESRFKLRVSNRATVLEWLKYGHVHVALVEGQEFRGPFYRRTIATDELSLITPVTDDPFDGKERISVSELTAAPFIIREFGSGTLAVIEEALSDLGISVQDLNVILELDNVGSIKAAVEAGRGVSVISTMAIRKELRTGTLRTVEVEGHDFRQKIYIAWQRDRVQKELEKLFVSFLRSPHRGFC